MKTIFVHPKRNFIQLKIFSFFLLLPLLAAIVPAAAIPFDINGDGVTGLEEAVYALQIVSGANLPLPEANNYVVFSWNDLGMHCLNPTYDAAVLLPPYNNVWAQVVKRGELPQILTEGLTVEYGILNNTYSYGKVYEKSDYKQFWDNAEKLFSIALEQNKGLNLTDPNIHNGLSGAMIPKTDHFQADGIPVTPVNDSGLWNPYQIAEIKVKNSGGVLVAETKTTVPTSDEINCSKCHYGANTFDSILKSHDNISKTALSGEKPVLCAKCHGSPALGTTGAGSSGKYLSQAIHGYHSTKSAVCYDCHPGAKTKCSRSIAHTAADGNCTACHGTMSEVASSIANGTRTPWVNEPKCAKCHDVNIPDVDTGTTLYRNAKGHGGLYCTACHGSPHAMIPTTTDSDNYQATQFAYYQNNVKTIGSCGVCHGGSKGNEEDIADFAEQHGGVTPKQSTACNICHTSVPSPDKTKWPHGYQWKNRN